MSYDRPASRGSAQLGSQYGAGFGGSQGVSNGGGVPGTARPGSGFRRLGTGMGTALPPTAAGSGAVSGVGVGVGLNTSVVVDDRPVTQQGMVGLNPGKSLGPSRRVQDKSFFLSELRQKTKELTAVVQDMTAEVDEFERNSSTMVVLKKREGESQAAVKELQGKLADLNIILDKAGTDTHQEEIQEEYLKLKGKNDIERKRLNAVFTERSNMEQRITEAESQIAGHKRNIENKLNELAPAKRKEYLELQAENGQLQLEKTRLENALQAINEDILTSRQEISVDHNKRQALHLTEQNVHISEKKFELEAAENKLNLDPEEQQKELVYKIRQDKADIGRLDEQAAALRTTINRLKGMFDSFGLDKEGRADNGAVSYSDLKRRKQKLEKMIDNLMTDMSDGKTRLKEQKQNIVGTLESLAHADPKASTDTALSDLQTELDYKQVQYKNSQHTNEQLEKELEVRKDELGKIDTLEDKIQKEVDSIHERMGVFEKEMSEFPNGEELKVKVDQLQQELEKCRKRLLERKDVLNSEVSEKKKEYEGKQHHLSSHPKYITFEKEEVKMRKMHQEIFALEDFIKQKESETDCSQLAGDIIEASNHVNSMIKKLVLL
ncbi:Intraflagellar transport protein 74-like [Chloropicon primus]|uniref:Intraflagellar transport protein 74-like n=1 Tax=Chloropicon primus TaxID=1764295 RepID=A0A5B8MR60_9CHLO|nr:Intraflagellar transport protein 74-like [Chloropicon primus]|eukprot:QDZ21732.1 Intraflagellar transport protein 74-like [Chloropicon primus]